MTSYGINLNIRIFGGSHDEEIGVIAEGLPAGIRVDEAGLQAFMARRAPGQSKLTTSRKEPDIPVFTDGLENGVTTGGTLRAVIRNTNQRSSDYKKLAFIPRPSHADYPAMVKSHGHADLRGGGHFSGRLTAPMCIIGGILKQELERRGTFIGAHIASVGAVKDKPFDPVNLSKADFDAIPTDFPVIDRDAGEKMKEVIDAARMELDSVGGVVEFAAVGLPVGIGEHMFGGMEGRISSVVFGIPAVKGIEFGDGFASASALGSENNDPYTTDGRTITTVTNHCGGILGGMTIGMPLICRAAIKPTPSIGKPQQSVDMDKMENTTLEIGGRHDPCIVQRAVPVFEAALAIAVYDALLDSDNWEDMER
ncbi:MAG: chorismate synthase [Clostridia bacterium]|nr:chorismate synthase [Clostridia bacterium]